MDPGIQEADVILLEACEVGNRHTRVILLQLVCLTLERHADRHALHHVGAVEDIWVADEDGCGRDAILES
jgi:hypothetical protein